jgi:hypothetical protein
MSLIMIPALVVSTLVALREISKTLLANLLGSPFLIPAARR